MSSRYKNENRRGKLSSSSSSSSASTNSDRSRSRSSSSSSSRSKSPEYQRTKHEGRVYQQNDRSDSDTSDDRICSYATATKYNRSERSSLQSSNQKYTDGPSLDYNSIRSDKSSETPPKIMERGRNDGGRGRSTQKNIIHTDDTPETAAAAPPLISKSAILFGKPGTVAKPGIQMKLMPPKAKTETTKKITVASAFNNESDDEQEEEMPAECRMRMRNIGRDTPTSSGPNSFGKTKQGFVDTKKVFERNLREACAD